jgi:hypothetical protein
VGAAFFFVYALFGLAAGGGASSFTTFGGRPRFGLSALAVADVPAVAAVVAAGAFAGVLADVVDALGVLTMADNCAIGEFANYAKF